MVFEEAEVTSPDAHPTDERGLQNLTNWHFWLGTYLGTRPPTVRYYQTVSFPRSPRVLLILILALV